MPQSVGAMQRMAWVRCPHRRVAPKHWGDTGALRAPRHLGVAEGTCWPWVDVNGAGIRQVSDLEPVPNIT